MAQLFIGGLHKSEKEIIVFNLSLKHHRELAAARAVDRIKAEVAVDRIKAEVLQERRQRERLQPSRGRRG